MKNSEMRPQLRFGGFADAWVEKKLGDVANRFDNLRVSVVFNKRVPGTTPYYGANGIQDYVEGHCFFHTATPFFLIIS